MGKQAARTWRIPRGALGDRGINEVMSYSLFVFVFVFVPRDATFEVHTHEPLFKAREHKNAVFICVVVFAHRGVGRGVGGRDVLFGL